MGASKLGRTSQISSTIFLSQPWWRTKSSASMEVLGPHCLRFPADPNPNARTNVTTSMKCNIITWSEAN
eukprot:4905708-Amphidinium_carterae.1